MTLDHTKCEAAVRRALDRVTDPELDEPVTDLRFIERLTVDQDGSVSIGFRLPTYWCAANFAFLMADDMRREVGALPWVRKVRVTLGEHMYADKINHGLEHGLSFQATFGDEASAELDDLRRTFLVKAFQRRQESLLRHLTTLGYKPATIVSMTLPQLQALPIGPEGGPLRQRYVDRREVCAGPDTALAFVDTHCSPLSADTLLAYLQALGRVTINAEFNGALCRGLLAARFNEDGEPSLYDFARMAPGKAV
jgi:metal-sulfur cluster biosynthetic enzyme